MADHHLRPTTRHRLGRPLPYQQPDRTRTALKAAASKDRPPFALNYFKFQGIWNITSTFAKLSSTSRYVVHVLLTRLPLSLSNPPVSIRKFQPTSLIKIARLACLIHAASVHSEPGSNPPKANFFGIHNSIQRTKDKKSTPTGCHHYQIYKLSTIY